LKVDDFPNSIHWVHVQLSVFITRQWIGLSVLSGSKGLIQPNSSWKKFLKTHWKTQFAMDFMMIASPLLSIKYLKLLLPR